MRRATRRKSKKKRSRTFSEMIEIRKMESRLCMGWKQT